MSVQDSPVAIPGTSNLRDLGGYPVAGGARVAPGRLLRSEVLVAEGAGDLQGVWHPAHTDLFRGLGLHTVIDLRSETEVVATASAWAEASGAEVVRLPIEAGGEGPDTSYVRMLLSGERASFLESDMAQFYCDTIDACATTFGAAVRVLSAPGALPALVHCSAGKDRTGLLVALVLDLLGTPRELIVEDYALTDVLRPDRVRAYADLFEDAGVDVEDVRALFEAPESAMWAVLHHLDERYAGTAAYLAGPAGVPQDELDALAHRLVSETTHDPEAKR